MSSFTFDFDLQDDLDESFDFDAIPPQGMAAAPSINKNPVPEGTPQAGGVMLPADEIPLSALVRRQFLASWSHQSY